LHQIEPEQVADRALGQRLPPQ